MPGPTLTHATQPYGPVEGVRTVKSGTRMRFGECVSEPWLTILENKPMKTVELGYMSSGGTHFLFNPNLFDLPAEKAVGQNGKALVLLAFSKDWDICVAQAEEQATIKLGGQWSFAKENLHCTDDDGHDIAKLMSGTPKMALSAVPA